MSKSTRKRGPIWREIPFLTGIAITVLVFGVAVWSLSVGEVCGLFVGCVSKWDALKASAPNEIGDSLAGFAGTLAFVWLIVTVWLQATELREQREEFEKMADAQTTQVELLIAQGEIFADEQLMRTEARNERMLDTLLDAVREETRSAIRESFFLTRLLRAHDNLSGLYPTVETHNRYTAHSRPESYVREMRDVVSEWRELEIAMRDGHVDAIDVLPEFHFDDEVHVEPLVRVISRLREILDLESDLPERQRLRVSNIGVGDITAFLSEALETPENFIVRTGR